MELSVALGSLLVIAVSVSALVFFVRASLKERRKAALPDRYQRRHKRNTSVLWGLILLAIAYSVVLRYLPTLTGGATVDGTIGVALGLYICAHPAANAVNMLFFERDTLRRISEWSVVRWLALNLLVLLTGWMVVFLGLRRLVDRAG